MKSIPQTKLRFQKELIGMKDEGEVEYEDEKEGSKKVADGKKKVKAEGSGRQLGRGGGSGNKRKDSGKS